MITIIGAGPVGCFLAEKLAKAGKKVQIFEAKKSISSIGKPVQCTGLLTKEIEKIFSTKELKQNKILINEINKIKVIAPNNKNVIIPAKEFVFDREKFDKYLLKKAIKAGAKLILGKRITKQDIEKLQSKKIKNKKKNIIIGADGPNSIVRNILNPKLISQNYIGMQAIIKLKKAIKDHHEYIVFFGKEIAPDFFAWFVPVSKTLARAGLASKTRPAAYFKKLLNRIKKDYSSFKIIEKQAGLIPIFNPKLKIKNNTNTMFVVGDAASQVKATTGGGLVPGLFAAKELAKAIISKHIKTRKQAKKEQYIPKINNLLKIHLLVRNILNNFKNTDYNKLIRMLDNKKIKTILKNQNRDQPLKLLISLAIAQPRLAYYISKLSLKFK